MNIQNDLLEELKDTHPKLGIKELSDLVGLEKTRLFRLYNGMEMRLSEYLKIKKALGDEDQNYNFSLGFMEKEQVKNQFKRNKRFKSLIEMSKVA